MGKLTEGQQAVLTLGTARAILAHTVTEKDFQQAIRDAAAVLGWRCYHTYDSRRSDPGFPDLILVRPPRVIAWEVKSMKGRVTPEQDAWLRDLSKSGIEADVVRPRDIDWIIERLKMGQPEV